MSITDATCKYDRDVNFGSGRCLVCLSRMLSSEFYNLPIAFSLSVLSFSLSVLSLGSSLSLWDFNLCLPVIVGNWQHLVCFSGILSTKPWKCRSLPANWVHQGVWLLCLGPFPWLICHAIFLCLSYRQWTGPEHAIVDDNHRLPKCKGLELIVSGQCISTLNVNDSKQVIFLCSIESLCQLISSCPWRRDAIKGHCVLFEFTGSIGEFSLLSPSPVSHI